MCTRDCYDRNSGINSRVILMILLIVGIGIVLYASARVGVLQAYASEIKEEQEVTRESADYSNGTDSTVDGIGGETTVVHSNGVSDSAEGIREEIRQSPTSSCEITSVIEASGSGDNGADLTSPDVAGSYGVAANDNAASYEAASNSAVPNDALPNDAVSNELDFGGYITGATFEKQQNGLWVTVKDGIFTDGDAVRVTINYTVPANTVDGVNNAIQYQLPAGLVIKNEEQGYVTRNTEGGRVRVGTYTIGTDGLITITFYPEFADGKQFSGSIQFEAQLSKEESGGEGTIEIGGSGSTIKIIDQTKEYDIQTSKDCNYDQDENQLRYTIVVSSTKGTSDTVTITDAFKEGVNGAHYDENSYVLYYIDADGNEHDITGTWRDSLVIDNKDKHFSLAGLPALQPGERYVMRYTATPEQDAMNEGGYQKVGNWAYASSGNNGHGDGTETVIHESMLHKEGHYDANTGLITWTIVVNKGHETLDNYQITDPLQQGMRIQGDVTVVERTREGIESTRYITPVEDGDVNPTQIRMTFSGDSQYTITFQTNAPATDPQTGKVMASNTITDDDGRKATGETEVKDLVTQIDKKVGNESYDEETGTIYRGWDIEITVPAGENDTIVYRDRIDPASYRNGTEIEDYSNTHYTTWAELSQLTEETLHVTRRSGYDITQSLGVSIRAWTTEDKEVEVPSSDLTTPILYWEMTITPAAVNRDQIAGIGFSYRTITDYSRMPSDTEWRFQNVGMMNDKSSYVAFDREQRKRIEKQAASVWKGHREANTTREGFQSGEVSWELAEDGTYWYRLVVRTSYETKGTITITDDLPEGLEIAGLDEFCNDKDAEGFATLKTSWNLNYDDACPVLILMGNEQRQSQPKYRVERVATVSYNKETRHLEIRIPYEDTTEGAGYDYQHWYGDDGTQTLSLPYFEIAYKVTVTDSATTSDQWTDTGDGNSVARRFVNKAAWGSDNDSVTTTVTRPKKRIAKYVSQQKDGEDPTSIIEYSVVINTGAEDLDPTRDILTLTDTLTTAEGVTARLLIDSVQLYAYDGSKADQGYHGEEPLPRDLFRITDIQSEGVTHTFRVTLPDERACVLVYRYDVDLSRTTTEEQRAISNNASLNGKWSEEVKRSFEIQKSSSEVSYRTVYVYKVDAADRKVTLPGVQFRLQRWERDTDTGAYAWKDVAGGHGDHGWYRTDENGRLTLHTAEDTQDATLYANSLYRLEEMDLGDNTAYAMTSEPMYFMLHEVGQESAESAFGALGEVSDTVDGSARVVAFSQVHVCELAGSNGVGVLYFTNSRRSVLPSTGGAGTLALEIAGVGMIILAMAIVVVLYRRRK